MVESSPGVATVDMTAMMVSRPAGRRAICAEEESVILTVMVAGVRLVMAERPCRRLAEGVARSEL